MESSVLESQSYTKTQNLIRWKSGKRVEPKLLALLESFGEIYIEHRQLFKKIFEDKYDDLFKKIGDALKRRKQMNKAKSMGRSKSLRMRAIGEQEEEVRLERFKVKTPNVIVVAQDDTAQGGQTQTTQASSKDSKLLN